MAWGCMGEMGIDAWGGGMDGWKGHANVEDQPRQSSCDR